MIGVSGCFGGTQPLGSIDDIGEAAAAVEEIVSTGDQGGTPEQGQPSDAPNMAMAQLVGQYVQRVRLLTWAVVAIVFVMVMREVKD